MSRARDMRKILVVLVGVAMISTGLFAGQKSSNAPTASTDGAVWSGNGGYGHGDSLTTTTPGHGNSGIVHVNGHSSQASSHISMGDYMKSLLRNLGFSTDGAVWGFVPPPQR